MRLLSGTWFPFSTILAMALAGCAPQGNPEPELTVKKTCPDHDVVARFKAAHARVPPVLASLGDSVDIPEFHDCQRLLEPDSASQGVKYGPHVAVFRLDGAHLGSAVAAAVVWNLDYPKTYSPLGITTEFACLFVDQANDGPQCRGQKKSAWPGTWGDGLGDEAGDEADEYGPDQMLGVSLRCVG